MPPPPQGLRSKILEYGTNYSNIEVMWEPPGNDSRVDFYHHKIVDSLGGASMSYQANTTNTTVILSGILYGINISFFLSANNCAGKSAPAILIIMNIGKLGTTFNIIIRT